ncbi:reductase [Salmonella enterica subsp. diarizonae]|uniref:Reductase n=1 Tax=Salmonella diarizonae TaxID=59204 RepID=A0A379TVS1_SALDZ|nr:reductase [Salmonella enterica subsp. diarizonae]
MFAPSAEFRGGRFSDTDNIIYQQISGWRDLIWHEKSHMSPNTIITPITETLFYFDKDTIQIAETDTSPIVIFARACDINAMSRLDYMYLSNGNNSDYSYQLLREHIRFVLIECEESFENCFCVSMGTNKTDRYSAAMRFSDEGAFVSIRDPFIEAAIQGLGQEANYTPSFVSENRETVVTPDSVCRDPQKIRDILTRHPLWDAYDSRCISCGRCTTGCPTCTCYSVFDVAMMKIHSAVNAVASGQAAWCQALATWPVVMAFAKNPASVCATAPCIRSMTTKRATALNICASAAAAATIAAHNTSNFLLLSTK